MQFNSANNSDLRIMQQIESILIGEMPPLDFIESILIGPPHPTDKTQKAHIYVLTTGERIIEHGIKSRMDLKEKDLTNVELRYQFLSTSTTS